jgi:enediyne biosynthesis protein E4
MVPVQGRMDARPVQWDHRLTVNHRADTPWPGLPRAVVFLATLFCSPAHLVLQGAPSTPASVPGVRSTELRPTVPASATSGASSGFVLIPPSHSGISFTNRLDELAGAANRILYNGAGLAAADYDGDGRPDLFFCDLQGRNRLYRNLGDWRFEDTTSAAGLDQVLPETRGAAFADLNGDGHLDLLVSVNGRGVLCRINDGRGRFTDATSEAGTWVSGTGPTTLALADVDGNGTLDLYVTRYRPDDIRDRGQVKMRMVNGQPVLPGAETNRFTLIDGRLEERGQADQLYWNDGTGRFRAAGWTDGTFLDGSGNRLSEPPWDWGLSATFRDLNGDGAPDLYVCNDYWTPDRCWINDGHGRFRALAEGTIRKTPASSMGADFADIDRDGRVDGFFVDMLSRFPAMRKRQGFAQMLRPAPVGGFGNQMIQVMRNTLCWNRGDGTYAEIAGFANLTAADWAWSPIFTDVDLDGYEDLLVGAGHFRDVQDFDGEAKVQASQRARTGFATDADRQKAFTQELMDHYRFYPKLDLPIGAFRNLGQASFEETTSAWGLDVPGVNHGLALADFDGDGALDLAVNRLNAVALLFRNRSTSGRLAVRLVGNTPNTQAIGAQVTLLGGAVPRQTTEVIGGGRYLSGSDTLVSFATGSAEDGMRLEVRWRDGTLTTVNDVRRNRLYEIRSVEPRQKTSPADVSVSARNHASPLFEDLSSTLNHRHAEEAFDDFERQPLLPYKLSQAGPGVAWVDLDADGDDDLVVGAGRGGVAAAFRNEGGARFSRIQALDGETAADDMAGMVAWMDDDGQAQVLAGLTGYESRADSPVKAMGLRDDRFRWLPAGPTAPGQHGAGTLAMGDPLGDGRLHLFAGGGVIPGQYPAGAPSQLWRRESGAWRLDQRNSALLVNLGIVNSAVWSDLTGDGRAELVLACEWGPIRIFQFRGPVLTEVTDAWGLSTFTGWWRGVVPLDLNGDGRLDLVASNWGWNSPYRASRERPLVLVHGQLAQPGVVDLIETEWIGNALAPRRQLAAMARSLPFLLERFSSHRDYSEATLDQVLGDRLALSRRASVQTLASMVFINTGQSFRAAELPREAQFAPGFGLAVADFDGDGHEDVFMAQNLSAVIPEITALDAGLGLWLRGDGSGGLSAMSPMESGIRMTGDQRGAAVSDMDGDGRPDLVVAQNGGDTRLFRNRGGRPGLRVRLKGPPTNPSGLGAVLRFESGGRTGPAREVHGGSGYWSQESLVSVLALPAGTSEGVLTVRWPGGAVTRVAVPSSTREITVDLTGAAAVKADAANR